MQRRATIKYIVVALLVVGLALLVWNGRTIHAQAQLGAAYGARMGCSCRYVEGRAMGSCASDKEPGMALVTLTDRPELRAVEAHVPLLASRTAHYRPGWGCLLDPVS